jgi:hypothetical protein
MSEMKACWLLPCDVNSTARLLGVNVVVIFHDFGCSRVKPSSDAHHSACPRELQKR